MNLGPPGERNKEATTLDPAFAASSWTVDKSQMMTLPGEMRRVLTSNLRPYHDFSQPSTSNFAELCICFMVQNRPAVPNRKNFIYKQLWAVGWHSGCSCLTLPVCLTESHWVKFFQQEVCHNVESVLIWFVKHIPDNIKEVRIELNIKDNLTENVHMTLLTVPGWCA